MINDYGIGKDFAVRIRTESVEQTELVGAALARELVGKGEFIALSGELGAGKTAFTRGLASILSPGSSVKSPTYTIVNEYDKGRVPFYHFDLYRIKDADDLYSTGYYDYIDSGICAVEWSSRACGELPLPRWQVTISQNCDDTRDIDIAYIKTETQIS